MTYLEELKEFAQLHARAQGVPRRTLRQVLRAVQHDGDGPDSWAGAWTSAAALQDGLRASAMYGLARFPFVDGPARQVAHQRSVDAFERWRVAKTDAERRTLPGFSYYATRDAGRQGRPLLIVIGGIVSTKEQWGPLLKVGRRLGMGVAVAELPGVGENQLRYEPNSGGMLSALLDDLGAREAYVLGMSFGGHVALQAALTDARIRGVATVGAPLRAFFTEQTWASTPRVTRRTLATVTGRSEAQLGRSIGDWALSEADLARLTIPVAYVASGRDEIIPREEWETLERVAPNVRVIEFDDVHGSPHHLPAMRLWLVHSLLRMRGANGPRERVLGGLLRLRRVAVAP